MMICASCRKEIKVGQRILENYILQETVPYKGLMARKNHLDYQHANCFDIEGPRYDDNGVEIVEEQKGYIKHDD